MALVTNMRHVKTKRSRKVHLMDDKGSFFRPSEFSSLDIFNIFCVFEQSTSQRIFWKFLTFDRLNPQYIQYIWVFHQNIYFNAHLKSFLLLTVWVFCDENKSWKSVRNGVNKVTRKAEIIKLLILSKSSWVFAYFSMEMFIFQPARKAHGPEGPARWER